MRIYDKFNTLDGLNIAFNSTLIEKLVRHITYYYDFDSPKQHKYLVCKLIDVLHLQPSWSVNMVSYE